MLAGGATPRHVLHSRHAHSCRYAHSVPRPLIPLLIHLPAQQALADCTGHFGYIRLELPVFHIGYFKNTVQILQCICKQCSRVLLPDEERRRTLR